MQLNSKKINSQLRTLENVLRMLFVEVFGKKRPADRALTGFFRENHQLGSRDRAFISESVFAFLRCWGLLRKFLPEEKRSELETGGHSIRAVELRALIFSALFMEKIQMDSARQLVEELNLTWPEKAGTTLYSRAQALSVLFQCNQTFSATDLIPNWVEAFLPPEFPLCAVLSDLERRPPMWLRCQTADVDALYARLVGAGLEVQRHETLRRALAIRNAKVNLFTLDAFKEGLFEVQDLASQCIGLAASPKKGERWLDCCAGAGGKTLQLADLMERTGSVVGSDIRAYKLEDLRMRARRAGFPNIITREWDGKALKEKHATFDGVLVDAPCSCSGVWRRNPDGRWTLSPEELPEIARLQLEILNHASGAVKPGGVLVYATCSMFELENYGVVRSFLAENPQFVLDAFPHPLYGALTDGTMQIVSSDGDCDCMFAARMRRRNKE